MDFEKKIVFQAPLTKWKSKLVMQSVASNRNLILMVEVRSSLRDFKVSIFFLYIVVITSSVIY